MYHTFKLSESAGYAKKRGKRNMSQQDLESLRSQIDSLNLDILRLINERAAVVEEIGKIKEKQGVNRYDPLRERHMLDLIQKHNNGPLNQMTLDYIFK